MFSRVVVSLLDGARPAGGAERRDDLLPSRPRLARRLTARPAAGRHPGGRADRRPAQGQGVSSHLQESESALQAQVINLPKVPSKKDDNQSNR